MGKTELARKFAEAYHDDFPNVAWINAETEASMKRSFENVAEVLGLSIREGVATPELAKKVFQHTGEHIPKSLFIYDNANCLKTKGNTLGILECLPRQSHKYNPLVLITSLTTEWKKDHVEVIQVDGLSHEESVEFFRKQFDITDVQLMGDGRLHGVLRELSEHLQGYPLGLQVAAGNVEYASDECHCRGGENKQPVPLSW